MLKLSLTQGPPTPEVSRDQLREQIRQQVQQATAEARAAAQEGARAAREAAGAAQRVTVGPGGAITIKRPFDPTADIPPRAQEVAIAFFVVMAICIIGYPIMRAIGKRIERAAPAPMQVPAELQAQIQQLVQSVDAIAIEVERISEGQRFATKMLTEKRSDVLPRV
ncbi:MAG TPA: hypothetical protein VIF83_15715 [Gemmatimonadaceae bacterium]|jgi:hypothetical protein